MSSLPKTKARRAMEIIIAFVPWVAATFTLYWLQYGQVWTPETPHRGKTSVAILMTGMALSFLLNAWFTRRER